MGDMSLILYRQATENDAQDLKDIAKRIINTNYVPFLGTDLTATFIESGMSDQEIDEGLTNCTLMMYNGQIIGFVITNKDILHLIMIDVPFQNAGHGSILLAYIEAELFLNYKCIYLQSFKDNELATQFYLKNGWILVSEEEVPELGKIMSQFEKHKTITESNLLIT
jgi:ribosomal protein S18 acetylase RimI-like enzyme